MVRQVLGWVKKSMLLEQFEKKAHGLAERQFEENPNCCQKPKDQLRRLRRLGMKSDGRSIYKLGETWEGGMSREILKIPLGLLRREEYFEYCGTRGLEEAEPCPRQWRYPRPRGRHKQLD